MVKTFFFYRSRRGLTYDDILHFDTPDTCLINGNILDFSMADFRFFFLVSSQPSIYGTCRALFHGVCLFGRNDVCSKESGRLFFFFFMVAVA